MKTDNGIEFQPKGFGDIYLKIDLICPACNSTQPLSMGHQCGKCGYVFPQVYVSPSYNATNYIVPKTTGGSAMSGEGKGNI